MRIFTLLFLLAAASGSAQSVDQAMKPYVKLWQDDQVDSIKNVLPELLKKYPDKVETKFFSAVFESDADKALPFYEALLAKRPNHPFADECLFRLMQFAYAKGTYQAARMKFEKLQKDYPHSPLLPMAIQLFSETLMDTLSPVTIKSDTTKIVKSGGRKYALQVGAFSMMQNANELKSKIMDAGFEPVDIIEKKVNGKKLFAVWVGAFDSKNDAQKKGQELKEKLHLDFSIQAP